VHWSPSPAGTIGVYGRVLERFRQRTGAVRGYASNQLPDLRRFEPIESKAPALDPNGRLLRLAGTNGGQRGFVGRTARRFFALYRRLCVFYSIGVNIALLILSHLTMANRAGAAASGSARHEGR